MPSQRRSSLFAIIAPGLVLAATSVGAGDLVTAAVVASDAGVTVLWAAVIGAAMKWVFAEGIARWQLATGSTLLEGWSWRLGGWTRYAFLAYLLLFSVIVGRALTSACGVAASSFWQLGDMQTSTIIWGIVHSAIGVALVLGGSFQFFERLMSLLVGVMTATVLASAVAIAPRWDVVAKALIPSVPAGGATQVLALMGGIGGTVVLLSYGYWIQEQGRAGHSMLRICRIDLAVGNGMTGLFGAAVIVIASRLELQGGGAGLAVQMADQLALTTGPAGRWIFLIGFWAAVFSSLLGVWQSIPYLFADAIDIGRGSRFRSRESRNLRGDRSYRGYVLFIAIVPLFFLGSTLRSIQLLYGVFAAFFLPALAITLLIMNNRKDWVGPEFRSPAWLNALLLAAVLFFLGLGLIELLGSG